MRAVEDDHVDRPGVQARRRVEPTGTNRPIGLIAPVIRVRVTRHEKTHACRRDRPPPPNPARASPRRTKSQTNCDVPVWWPERRAQNPIPSRTRPLNTPAPMVLCLKTRESRSPPDPHIASQDRTTKHSLSTIGLQPIRRRNLRNDGSARDRKPWRGVEQPGSSSGS